MVRILCSVSGTCPDALPTAQRFSIWAFSMFFCTVRVSQYRNGSRTKSTIASPLFFNQITTRILIILQASANMLMIPEVNRFSTVSTSPTNRDTIVPGSCFVSSPAVRFVYFSIMLLRSAWVIFWPKTVSRPSRRLSVRPVSTVKAKYSITNATGTVFPVVIVSTILPRIQGGRSAVTMAPATANRIPSDSPA